MAGVDADDKYTAAIEVSNACRMFYVSRLQTAETLKHRLVDRRRAVRAAAASACPRGPDRQTAVDDTAARESVVAQLHKELASLIDIDLQVMRQLLILNDQLEELKWQRRQQQQQQHRKALLSSTCATPSIDDTDCSDTERQWSRGVAPNTPDSWSLLPLHRPSRDDDEEATLKYPTPSALSLLRGGGDDRFSDSGSVDALDRPNPDTPEVFPATPQTTAGRRTAVARPSPPKNPGVRTSGDGQAVMSRSKDSTRMTDRRDSTADIDHKLPTSPTKTKEHDLHSTNTDSSQDFCTYVEMLI